MSSTKSLTIIGRTPTIEAIIIIQFTSTCEASRLQRRISSDFCPLERLCSLLRGLGLWLLTFLYFSFPTSPSFLSFLSHDDNIGKGNSERCSKSCFCCCSVVASCWFDMFNVILTLERAPFRESRNNNKTIYIQVNFPRHRGWYGKYFSIIVFFGFHFIYLHIYICIQLSSFNCQHLASSHTYT